MDKDVKRNVRLGFFVLTGILLFIIGIFLIGSKDNMFTKNIRVSALFSNTGGLEAGNYVYYNGVKVGVVKFVTLQNDSIVKVDMQIDNKLRTYIKKQDVAMIASEGLMGGKIINIVPGKTISPPVEDNDLIQSANPVNIDLMMKTLSVTSENINVITDNLKKFTSDLNKGRGALSTLVNDTAMAENLQQSFSNIKSLTGMLSAFGSSLQHVMNDVNTGKNSIGAILKDTMLASNLATSVSQFKITSDKLLLLSDQLSTTVSLINTGNGPIPKLLTDSVMAADLDQSIDNIKQASAALNENMEALKHTIFLRGYYKKKEKDAE